MLHLGAGYRSARPIISIRYIRLATHGHSIQMGSLGEIDRDCNIELPPSPDAIMRRSSHLPRREQWPGKDDHGELDAQTRN
jgi:hypothetical protein